jgi:hypothetical protein
VDAITFDCNVLNPPENLIESYSFVKKIQVENKFKEFKIVVKPLCHYKNVLNGIF